MAKLPLPFPLPYQLQVAHHLAPVAEHPPPPSRCPPAAGVPSLADGRP
jgi:hypothetical protein